MRRISLLSAVLMLLLCLTACGSHNIVSVQFYDGADVTMASRWQIYDKSIDRVDYYIINNTGGDLTLDGACTLLHRTRIGWEKTELQDGDAFSSVNCIVPDGGTWTSSVSISGLKKGVYRIVKLSGGIGYYAEFEIGKSDITASEPYGIAPLDTLPRDYPASLAAENGDVVLGSGAAANGERFDEFLKMVSLGVPDTVRLSQYTVDGKAVISDIVYNGCNFTITTDSSRDNFSAEALTGGIYSSIITDGSGIFLSNCRSYDDARSLVHGLDENTVSVTYSVESGWCDAVAEIEQTRIDRGDPRMTVWLDSDTCCAIGSDGTPGYSDAGYSELAPLPDDEYDVSAACGIAWIDKTSFVAAAENSDDPYFKYILFVYELTPGAPGEYTRAYSANGYEVVDGALIVGD